jgi:Rrf2 family protein
MKLSKSISYGIVALEYIAKHQDGSLILSDDISKRYGIPLEYLFKILQQFVKAGILHSKRGPGGGYSLAKPLKKVSMLDVIEAVEGPMKRNLKIAVLAPKEKFGPKAEAAIDKAYGQAKVVFDKTKMSDVL